MEQTTGEGHAAGDIAQHGVHSRNPVASDVPEGKPTATRAPAHAHAHITDRARCRTTCMATSSTPSRQFASCTSQSSMRRHGTRQTNLICEIERAFGTLCWAQKLFVVHGGDLCNGDAALQHAALSCNVQHLNQPVTTCRVAEAVPHAHCGDLCDGNAPCFASVCFGPARRPLDDLGAPVHFLSHAPRPAGQLASAPPGHIAPGPGSPLPHPHRDRAHPFHIAPGLGWYAMPSRN